MELENYKNFEQYRGKTILSVDYGNKVTGLALFTPGSTPMVISAGRVFYKDDESLVAEIKTIADDEVVELFVVGLPIRSDGSDSKQTKKVRAFAAKLKSTVGIETLFQDEHLSSQAAKDRMLNSPQYDFKIQMDKIDEVSAIIILEDFIRANGA